MVAGSQAGAQQASTEGNLQEVSGVSGYGAALVVSGATQADNGVQRRYGRNTKRPAKRCRPTVGQHCCQRRLLEASVGVYPAYLIVFSLLPTPARALNAFRMSKVTNPDQSSTCLQDKPGAMVLRIHVYQRTSLLGLYPTWCRGAYRRCALCTNAGLWPSGGCTVFCDG